MNEQRRAILNAGAAALLAGSAQASGQASAQASAQTGTPAPAATIAPGIPGQFDFLTGDWKISHRRLKAPGDWDVFEGEATCWSILGGVASIEELRIPARNFSGMGLRLLDVANQVWVDYWVNARSGALGATGTPGGFDDGVGIFEADDMDGDTPIKARGTWDRITPASCRWRQSTSRDGGRTWEDNWLMDWARA